MDADEAAALIRGAMPAGGGSTAAGAVWADLGAGSGTFTRALASLLGASGKVYAIDHDPRAVAQLHRLSGENDALATVVPMEADFTDPARWRALTLPALDGLLLANALHFVPGEEQGALLGWLAGALAPRGRLVIVEYADRAPNRWVPYPVSLERLGEILPASLDTPRELARRRSAFGGMMYAAVAESRSPAP